MSDIEVKRWENKLLKIDLWVIRIGKEFWFFGKELADALGYANPKEAIQNNIDSRDKKTIKELLGPNYKIILQQNFSMGAKNLPIKFFQNMHPDSKVAKTIGVYSFCIRSKMSKVEPFQRWVYETIEEIRTTGSYTLPNGPVDNPLDLIAKAPTLDYSKSELKTSEKETQTHEKIKRNDFERLRVSIKKSLKKIENEMEKIEMEMDEMKYELEKISKIFNKK